jgi:hypothetical protein
VLQAKKIRPPEKTILMKLDISFLCYLTIQREWRRCCLVESWDAKVKIPESIRGEKEVEQDFPFAHVSVETENKKKEILACQLAMTS